MLLKVEHQLCYHYSQAVFLTPHYIYLSPKPSANQEVKEHKIDIQPTPNILINNMDVEGNIQHIAFINEPCEKLNIKSSFVVETKTFNSFDFIYFPFEAESLPFKYPPSEAKLLQAYLTNQSEIPTTIHHYVRQLAAEAGWKTSKFLIDLCANIQKNFQYETRLRGEAYPAESTLISKRGSCRDYSVLMIEGCKALGIAARFVSGYCYGSELHAHELHAWVEVYLPGGGWRGFDPTDGKPINHTYIALASSAQPELINPITGNYRGNATSVLETEVNIFEI